MLETLGAVLFVQTPVQKENGAIIVLLKIGPAQSIRRTNQGEKLSQ